MKRTVPLIITAFCGIVIVVAMFSPTLRFIVPNKGLDDLVATWFDILAAVAFILGGGNLMKQHLKKVSDQKAGWGYSVVTLVAFLAMLYVGISKTGVPPADKTEFYGETFAALAIDDLPDELEFEIDGVIPPRGDGRGLPLTVRQQIRHDGKKIKFRGWMSERQKGDLIDYQDDLEWRCLVEQLYEKTQPAKELAEKVKYRSTHGALACTGPLENKTRDALLKISSSEAWKRAVKYLEDNSRYESRVKVGKLPAGVREDQFPDGVKYDSRAGSLAVGGAMTTGQRDELIGLFAVSRPMDDSQRKILLADLEGKGQPLNKSQRTYFKKALDGSWTADQLIRTLDEAGQPQEVKKTYCDLRAEQLLAEKQQKTPDLKLRKTEGEAVQLNEQQRQTIRQFAEKPGMTADNLQSTLEKQGPLTKNQKSALEKFIKQQPTAGERDQLLWKAMLDPQNPFNQEQNDLLLGRFRIEQLWARQVNQLFVTAHRRKYGWSGNYRHEGSFFWWLYEYSFKPLTATMFAMLAFFVASAAFRAFRAKNLEASLLLATAFVILLGRTFAGVVMTSWIPDQTILGFNLSWLRIEEISVFIMKVFNTAGSRAIMIGIALGIASTSLKVILGIDRSYLGTGED